MTIKPKSRQARYRATAKGRKAEGRYRRSITGRKAAAAAAARYRDAQGASRPRRHLNG